MSAGGYPVYTCTTLGSPYYATLTRFVYFVLLLIALLALTTPALCEETLFDAALCGDLANLQTLIAAKADVNSKDGSGFTPLILAAERGHAACVKLLIDAGADVNAKSILKYAALDEAAKSGNSNCVKLLISSGANVDAKDRHGWTALMRAANWGCADCVEALIAAGADVNTKNNIGQTPLSVARTNEIKATLRAAGAK